MRNIILASFFLFSVSLHAQLKTVEIGLASNFSEVSSSSSNPYGDYFRAGVKLSIEHRQKELASKGLQIKLKEFDYGTSQVKVVTAANKACASSASVVLGYVYSSHALLATPIHQKCTLPFISPSGTASRLSEFKSYVHLASFSNSYQGKVLAQMADRKLKAKKALIISAEDCAYCTDLAKAFRKNFQKSKDKTVEKISMLSDDQNFDEVAKKAANIKADVILIPNHELFSARIIKALTQQGINGPFLGGDGWGNHGEQFIKVLNGQKITGFSVSHWLASLPSKKTKDFVKAYKAKFKKTPNDTAVLSYDSMGVVIEALLKAKSTSRKDIEQALRSVKKYEGVTGLFKYGKHGAPEKDIVLLKAGAHEYKLVKVLKPGELL